MNYQKMHVYMCLSELRPEELSKKAEQKANVEQAYVLCGPYTDANILESKMKW